MPDDHCLNCGARLHGPYCHACGQPVRGIIRQFKSIMGDILDTVFEYDSRIWRTLLPLYVIPGKLTLDFLAGRRIRFVTPFRLVFVLLVLAFLVMQFTVTPGVGSTDDGPPRIFQSDTVAEVEAARARALAELDEARAAAEVRDADSAAVRLAQAREAVNDEAQRRIDWLLAAEAARREGRDPPPEPLPVPRLYLNDDGAPWDAETNPLNLTWLPDSANDQLNRWIARGIENLGRATQEPDRFVDAFLSLLPAALFVMLPIFALLLKICYVFTGRLYMEHMVVALHSHAFLGLALMISSCLELLGTAVPAGFGLQTLLGFLYAVSLAWIPLYMLIMQRRVYAQGWSLTLIKYAFVGGVYTLLLAAALSAAAVITLIVS